MKTVWKHKDWIQYLKEHDIDEASFDAFMRLCLDAQTAHYLKETDFVSRNSLVVLCGEKTEHFRHIWPQEVINEALHICVTLWTKGMLESLVKKRYVMEGLIPEGVPVEWLPVSSLKTKA